MDFSNYTAIDGINRPRYMNIHGRIQVLRKKGGGGSNIFDVWLAM